MNQKESDLFAYCSAARRPVKAPDTLARLLQAPPRYFTRHPLRPKRERAKGFHRLATEAPPRRRKVKNGNIYENASQYLCVIAPVQNMVLEHISPRRQVAREGRAHRRRTGSEQPSLVTRKVHGALERGEMPSATAGAFTGAPRNGRPPREALDTGHGVGDMEDVSNVELAVAVEVPVW